MAGNQKPPGQQEQQREKTAEEKLQDLNDQVKVRFEKLQKIRDRKENPYKNGMHPNALASQLHRALDEKSKEELEALNHRCSVAGRIMAIRDFGKASFVRLKDRSGLIQLFVQKDKLGPEGYQAFKEMDLGD